MCYVCLPGCDNCKPKFIWCESCGNRAFLLMNECVSCGRKFTEVDKQKAIDDWRKRKAETLEKSDNE